MRKRYRTKRRSCGVCKPDKRGWTPRWNERELIQLREWERRKNRGDWEMP